MTLPGEQPPSEIAGFAPGTVVAGKYVVERMLGKGGMGVVLAAQHRTLREPVALKFLHGEALQKPALVSRFEREARAAARIKSEHVTRVFDCGKLDDGTPFIVMELLAGIDLHKHSAARGPLPFSEAALYVAQACEAVAEAHLYGIVHRDLKPANLFLTRRADGSPLVKVLDFGISKMADEADENLTATTDVLGSPLYMSPEQIESPRDVDARTDVWALGAILYKLLTGKAAFAAATVGSSLAKIVKDPPPPLHSLRPDVPPELEALVMRCLEKDVKNRLQTVAELAHGLAPFAGLPPPEATASGASYSRPVARQATSASRSRAMIAVAATTLVGGALAVGLVALRSTGAEAPASAATPPSATAPARTEAKTAAATAAPTAAAPAATVAAATAAPASTPTASASAAPTAAAVVRPVPKGPTRGISRGASGDAFSDRL